MTISKHKIIDLIRLHLYLYINAWIGLASYIVMILSFTLYRPYWEWKHSAWYSVRKLKREGKIE